MAKFEIEGTVLKRCYPEEDEALITVPDGITEIGEEAFRECFEPETINLPEGLTKIGENAFNSCEGLREIRLPDSLMEIGDDAFNWCPMLQKISFPDGLTAIGANAFRCDECLQDLFLPDSLKEIGGMAFGGCGGLKRVRFPAYLEALADDAFEDCFSICSIELAATPEEGSALHNWLAAFLPENLQIAEQLCREKTLSKPLAEIVLKTAQEQQNTELTALMLQYLH